MKNLKFLLIGFIFTLTLFTIGYSLICLSMAHPLIFLIIDLVTLGAISTWYISKAIKIYLDIDDSEIKK